MLVLWSLCSEGERSEAGLGWIIGWEVRRRRIVEAEKRWGGRGGPGGFNSSAAEERLPQ